MYRVHIIPHTQASTHLASERDEDGEELSLVPDDHAVADARELRLELVLAKHTPNEITKQRTTWQNSKKRQQPTNQTSRIVSDMYTASTFPPQPP